METHYLGVIPDQVVPVCIGTVVCQTEGSEDMLVVARRVDAHFQLQAIRYAPTRLRLLFAIPSREDLQQIPNRVCESNAVPYSRSVKGIFKGSGARGNSLPNGLCVLGFLADLAIVLVESDPKPEVPDVLEPVLLRPSNNAAELRKTRLRQAKLLKHLGLKLVLP